MTVMYQCRFINCNKCPALGRDVGDGGGSACAGAGVYGNLTYSV